MRRLALVLIAAVLVAGCGVSVEVVDTAGAPEGAVPAPAARVDDPAPPIREPKALQDVLDEAAAAFRSADPDALRPLLHDPESTFGQHWLDRARRMGDLPLSTYELHLDDVLPDLATDRVRDSYDGEVQVVYVAEELALEDFDGAPAEEDLFLTFVDEGEGWRVASDRDAEALGFVSVDHLWDHGDVTVTREGQVLAIHHPDGPPIGALLSEAQAALDAAADRWPLDWSQTVTVVVPRDQEELAELLHVTFDLSNFVAFATATPTGDLGEYELTGSRVIVNPGRFLDRSPETRQEILEHELVHVATRPAAGPMMPSWVEEGVAQVFGDQRSSTGTALLAAVASANLEPPTDGQFTTGGRDRVFLSYQLAWSFVAHLVTRYGAEGVGRFYQELGRGTVGRAGTETYHVDRAAREVFDASLEELVASWRANR